MNNDLENPYIGAQATGFILAAMSVAFAYLNELEGALLTLAGLVILTLGYYWIRYK